MFSGNLPSLKASWEDVNENELTDDSKRGLLKYSVESKFSLVYIRCRCLE